MSKVLSRLSAKRKKYYSMIKTYEMRRNIWRAKFGVFVNRKNSEEHKKKALMFSAKIAHWKLEIKRTDRLGDKISKLERAVFNFTGERISNYHTLKVSEQVKFAKSIYYKFGLENGIRGIELRDYIGLTGDTQRNEPNIYRTRFTKSFKNNPKNKEKWLQFKNFYNSVDFSKKHRYGAIDNNRIKKVA